MATDGLDPPPCDQDIYQNGSVVALTHGIGSNGAELFVKTIAYLSGQRVDWHFMAGRVRILAIGNLDAVRETIRKLEPLHVLLVEKNRNKDSLLADFPIHNVMVC